jgi:catalase
MTQTARTGTAGYGWQETYVGGSFTTENELNRRLARRIQKVQKRIARRSSAAGVHRAQHAKLLVGIVNAEFRVRTDVPEELRGEFFEPGASYPAVVRFSNCSGEIHPDTEPDLRGLAFRVQSPAGIQDFLATNAPASHARDPQQFMIVAEALSGAKLLVAPRMLIGLGVRETIRIMTVLRRGTSRPVNTLAAETFWSRCPIAFGACGVKYQLQPVLGAARAPGRGDDYLRDELIERLQKGPVVFDFKIQRFLDEQSTPIEDVVAPWDEATSPAQALAQLVIPQQDLTGAAGLQAGQAAEALDYTPWNCVPGFRPIGRMSRARRRVYEASAVHRKGVTH